MGHDAATWSEGGGERRCGHGRQGRAGRYHPGFDGFLVLVGVCPLMPGGTAMTGATTVGNVKGTESVAQSANGTMRNRRLVRLESRVLSLLTG